MTLTKHGGVPSTRPLLGFVVPTIAGPAHGVVTPEDGALRVFGWGDLAANIDRLPTSLQARGVVEGSAPERIARAVSDYCDGDMSALTVVPVVQDGGVFLQAAWQVLREIPAGVRISYTELATAAGNPSAVRAAGSACARNMVALVVPCHRVLRAGGGLGGYRYGADIKRQLLQHEQGHATVQ